MARKQPKFGFPGVYNATLPTYNDGEGSALQTDQNGRLLVAGSTGTTGNTQAATATGTPAFARYNTTAPTYTINNTIDVVQMDGNGNLKDTLATKLAGEDLVQDVIKVEQRFIYATISSATTTTIKNSPGYVQSISILGGTLGTITVYDNTAASGTTICPTFTPTSTLPAPSVELNCLFTTGLTIVTGSATIMQVTYR